MSIESFEKAAFRRAQLSLLGLAALHQPQAVYYKLLLVTDWEMQIPGTGLAGFYLKSVSSQGTTRIVGTTRRATVGFDISHHRLVAEYREEIYKLVERLGVDREDAFRFSADLTAPHYPLIAQMS
jgi:hypothetical protein